MTLSATTVLWLDAAAKPALPFRLTTFTFRYKILGCFCYLFCLSPSRSSLCLHLCVYD